MNVISGLIEMSYELERNPSLMGESSPFTIRVSTTHLCLLQIIAGRFGSTRAGFGVKLMEAAILEAWDALELQDRKVIAEKADLLLKDELGISRFWISRMELEDEYAAGQALVVEQGKLKSKKALSVVEAGKAA